MEVVTTIDEPLHIILFCYREESTESILFAYLCALLIVFSLMFLVMSVVFVELFKSSAPHSSVSAAYHSPDSQVYPIHA